MDDVYGGRRGTVSARDIRCSNAEREPVIEQLQQAFAEGRLDQDEFDMRVHLAMTAKTRGDLEGLTSDLVAPVPYPWDQQAAPADGEDRMLAALAHASGILTSFAGPLLFLLLSGKRSAYVRRHAVEALNFQLTLLLVTIVTFGLGGLLYAVAWILAIVAAVSAVSGGRYRYPFTLRLIR